MIFHSDGIFPLWGFIIMLIVFYSLRKENKERKTRWEEMDELAKNREEFYKAVEAVDNGAKILKLDDYKHLNESDLKHFINNRGVKFI